MADIDHPRLAREVLEAASLPQPAEIERAPQGIGNHVFFADDMVVRLGTGSDAPRFPRAVAVLRAASSRVKVPKVVYEDCTCSRFPIPVMVLTRMPGEPLSRTWPTLGATKRLDTLEAVAAELHALHTIRPQDVPAAGFSAPWWIARTTRIERLLAALRPTPGFPDEWFDLMARYFDDQRDVLIDSPPACVVHNDVNWGNVLVANGRVTALLDFDDVGAAPAEEDAWGLLFASDNFDPWIDLRKLQRLPGFDLTAHGVLERFRICEIESILDLLSGELSWIGREEAVKDANETYRDAFLSDQHERLLDQLR